MSADFEIGPYKVYVSETLDKYIVYFERGLTSVNCKSIELPKEVEK